VVFGWQEAYVGDHGYSPFGAPTSVPLSLSHGEIVQVEVKKAAQKEGSTLGAPTQEKTTEVPVPVEAVGAKVHHVSTVAVQMRRSLGLRTCLVGLPSSPGLQ
jgi:hypothetical protein